MKHPIAFLIPIIFVGIMWIANSPFPENPTLINKRFNEFKELPRPSQSGEIKFHRAPDENGKLVWRPIPPGIKSVRHDEPALRDKLAQLRNYKFDTLTPCNRFRYLRIENRLKNRILLKGKRLSTNFSNQNPSVRKTNYGLLLMTRYGINLSPGDVIAYGEQQFKKSLSALHGLEDQIIKEGLANSLEEFEKSHMKLYASSEAIILSAEARKPVIMKNYEKLFRNYVLRDAGVKTSLKTTRFHAIAAYDGNFIAFWDGQTFESKHLDYLMLHELIPGHHLQLSVKRNHPLCDGSARNRINTSAFTEGWATYAETLGPELGLFNDPIQKLGYLDWDLIRAIRIILDVRIHHDGWSDEQVKEYWQAHMPKRFHHLAERETKRMRKMPMQSLGYKFGANALLALKAKEQTRLGRQFDIKTFHDRLLRMGNVPLNILEDSYYALADKP